MPGGLESRVGIPNGTREPRRGGGPRYPSTPPGRLRGGNETWQLPDPVGPVSLVVHGTPLPTEIQFRGGGHDSEEVARNAGSLLRWWLRVTGVSVSAAFDFGDDNSVSRSFLDGQEQMKLQEAFSIFVLPDLHGLMTFEEIPGRSPARFSMRGRATVSIGLEQLRKSVFQSAKDAPIETLKKNLAYDLIAAADRSTAPSTRLITLVTGAEVMSPRRERTGASLELLDSFIKQASSRMKRTSDPGQRQEFETLANGLKELRRVSIGRSVVEATEKVQPRDPGSSKLVKKAYKSRSELVHRGNTVEDINVLFDGLRTILVKMIAAPE